MLSILSNLGINWKLFLAQAVNFLLVLWLLKRFVYPRLLKFIEEREEKIKKGLELRDQMEKELDRVEILKKREIELAKTEADGILRQAKVLGQNKKDIIESEAKNVAEKIISQAKNQAEKEKEETLLAAKEEIRKAAFLTAERALARQITKEDEEKIAEELLDYLEKDYIYAKK